MNNLQKLIKLRGLTVRDVAREIDQGYHITQKVIKGATYQRADGSRGVYSSRTVEEKVAQILGLTRHEAWGANSSTILRRLILKEIKNQSRQREKDLQKQWLHRDRITEKKDVGNV